MNIRFVLLLCLLVGFTGCNYETPSPKQLENVVENKMKENLDLGPVLEGDFYPLAKGNTWVYRYTDAKTKFSFVGVETITDFTDDNTKKSWLETKLPLEQPIEEIISFSKEGMLRHKLKGVEVSPSINFLKFPVQSGNRWKSEFKFNFASGSIQWETSTEKITVPAGEYDTIVVAGKEGDTTFKTWYAAGVGKVKQHIKSTLSEIVLELTEFKLQ